MRQTSCHREAEVAAAVRGSRLSGPLQEHAQGCDTCRETVSVAGFLNALAAQPDERPLPDASGLYRQARLASRLFGEPAPVDQAMRRLALAEALAVAASGLALVSWLAWAGAELWLRLAAWPGTRWLGQPALPLSAVGLFALGLLGASVSLIAMWPMLRED